MSTVLDHLTSTPLVSDELAALARRVQESVVVVRGTRSGGGSGVVWNDRGLIVTNYHVAPGETAEIETCNRTRLSGRVIARSEHDDLAAIQVDGDVAAVPLVPAMIGDSSHLRAGQLVVAVGNPLGERNAVTLGMISGAGKIEFPGGSRDVIQVAITLRPGNSGGALADVEGRVVGIPNMVVGRGAALAVPTSAVERLLVGATAGRSFFGLAFRSVELPASLVERHHLSATTGMLVMGVAPDSPADRAGLGIGDVVVRAEGTPGGADQVGDILAALRYAVVGQAVRLTVIRGGALHRFVVTPRAA
jgi:serine protease Do